jgi:hypothetical protein
MFLMIVEQMIIKDVRTIRVQPGGLFICYWDPSFKGPLGLPAF